MFSNIRKLQLKWNMQNYKWLQKSIRVLTKKGRFCGGIGRRVGVLANSLSSQIYVWDLWTAELALSIPSVSGKLWKNFLEKNYEEIMGVQKGYDASEY